MRIPFVYKLNHFFFKLNHYHSSMNKAVFLDRDGVIIRERGIYTYKPEDVIFNDGIAEALKILQGKGYFLVVISNQSGIGKGLYTKANADEVHKKILDFFKGNQVFISEIYYCPHHPDSGNCICRKPDSLLIEKALAVYGIDPRQSYFIGDMERDSEAALKAGLKPIQINSNDNLLTYLDEIR